MAVGIVAGTLVPVPASASNDQQPPSAEQQQTEVRQRAGEVDMQVDLLKAHSSDVTAALKLLEDNVSKHETALSDARDAAASAQADLDAAETAVGAAEIRVVQLRADADALAVQSYMAPPSWTLLDAFQTDSLTDFAVTEGLLDIQSESESKVINDLQDAQADLEHQRDGKATISADADEKQQEAEDQLAEVTAARDQQARFATAAQEALDQRLQEASNLDSVDKALSQQVQAEQAQLAQQLAAMSVPPAPPPTTPTGTVTTATVTCVTGGTITVAESIAGNVQQLLDASASDGLLLCGWGYRSTEEQIELRKEHCGTSDYAIWDMPSSQCTPPTARPGTSMHEQGLAIDFTCDGESITSHDNVCFQWLDANAASYGLYNYPAEPWHFSTDGT